MTNACRYTIEGRVQGVFFRASTCQIAESLGLTGHAINLQNGDVEVFACGSRSALDELEAWLRHGPPQASVNRVVAHQAEWRDLQGFRTG